eukprot:scaffold67027_cov18-Prasinocladus_malaysianus.AAC.1
MDANYVDAHEIENGEAQARIGLHDLTLFLQLQPSLQLWRAPKYAEAAAFAWPARTLQHALFAF